MSRLPLHVLPAFRTVARLANLRAAADELHLTHSAVSQQIKLLEEQLGFQVFERRGRRIALNPAGEALQRAVEPALQQLDDGMRAAAAAAAGTEHRIRVTLLPSFAQRWLLPRMGAWRERHPDIALELHASQQVVDLQREGVHAALRQGGGEWRGLASERLIESRLVVVGSPQAVRRMARLDAAAIADQPLLGHAEQWERWFALSGIKARVVPVAAFNDAGLMLQAAEQDLGLALARELLAADALRDGTLVRLSPLGLDEPGWDAYWLAYPPPLQHWRPLAALRRFLSDELARSQRALRVAAAGTAPAGPTGSRSRAPSAARAPRRAR
jgi:LysR family glycine cleavage system transcriptional activator